MTNKNGVDSGFSFSFVIVHEAENNSFYGMVKEVDGVVVKGTSEEEVIQKINKAIKSIMRAKKNLSVTNDIIGKKGEKISVREFQQNYQPC